MTRVRSGSCRGGPALLLSSSNAGVDVVAEAREVLSASPWHDQFFIVDDQKGNAAHSPGWFLVVDADHADCALSCASRTRSGASSWQGTHQDAHTLRHRGPSPRKAAGSRPGTGVAVAPPRARQAAASVVCGAGTPDQREGMAEGIGRH